MLYATETHNRTWVNLKQLRPQTSKIIHSVYAIFDVLSPRSIHFRLHGRTSVNFFAIY